MDNSVEVLFALVRAGLWEKDVQLSHYDRIDFNEVYRLADEQGVVGLVAAGLEHVVDVTPAKRDVIQFAGQTLLMEQQNIAMNSFIGEMLEKMKNAGIDAVLIKGQGVAQCYERPLWRSAGDIDLLLNEDNYQKGKIFLSGLSESDPEEYNYNKEYITGIQGWCLELHGSLRCGLSSTLNKGVDTIQQDICDKHNVRIWNANDKQIPLPEENDDVLLLFTHFIKHFYKGGLGIRQICDWCRLLWTYRHSIDLSLLEQRVRAMRLMPEWKAFASYAVEYLGMPSEAMPLYDLSPKWKRKASKIQSFIVKVGNFGQNIDISYYSKYPFLIRKYISMWRRISVLSRHFSIFPGQTLYYFPHVIYAGVWSAIRGE